MSAVIGVVAHPDRQPMANALARQVQADLLVFDWDRQGEQANHQAALEGLLEHDVDWIVLLEDDAVPCPDFRAELAEALDDAPAGIVSLYLGTGRWAGTSPDLHERVVRGLIEDADTDGARWISAGMLWHAVGVAIPHEDASRILRHLRGSALPTDQAITDWCLHHRVPVRYTWPSLVDHADTWTVTNHPDGAPRTEPRRAWRVVGA